MTLRSSLSYPFFINLLNNEINRLTDEYIVKIVALCHSMTRVKTRHPPVSVPASVDIFASTSRHSRTISSFKYRYSEPLFTQESIERGSMQGHISRNIPMKMVSFCWSDIRGVEQPFEREGDTGGWGVILGT